MGLSNVSKSTLFNASNATAADAANYPFGAIEPNVGRVAPDERLETGDRLAKLPKIVATQLGFIDIAGLVRGAWRVRDARAVPLAAAI